MQEACLYVLMRNDLDSLVPGKACAQACHAANMVQTIIFPMPGFSKITKRFAALQNMFDDWQGSRGFGTTIVLDTPFYILQKIRNDLKGEPFNWEDSRQFVYGLVEDPSYPVRDGAITHLLPLITCGFVFGDRNSFAVNSIVGNLSLYP